MTGNGRGHDTTAAPRVRRRRRYPLPSDPHVRRSSAAVVVYSLIALLVVGRLVQVQVLRADEYAARGEQQRDRFVTLPAERGRVYDRNGDVLAASVPAVAVVADPSVYVPDPALGGGPDARPAAPADVAEALAPLLGGDVTELQALLEQPGAFVYLGRQLDGAVGDAVMELGLPGVGVLPERRRTYPAGDLAASLLGRTDVDGVGVEGIELQHQQLLAGLPGWLAFERSEDGFAIPVAERELQPPVPGTDLVLTIDRQIQWAAEQAAAASVAATGARSASVVVLEVGTGDVLAMVTAVGEADTTSPTAQQRNRAVTDVFEPGSVQKTITAAAALEEGVVEVDTVMRVPDRIEVGGTVFRDSHEHAVESMTFAEVIETSSNVGTISVAQQLGPQRLADWLDRFGFGRRVGIGFPGEADGLLRDVGDWWGTSLPTIAIGQGIATTLLQSTNAYATIANDGVPVTPRIVRGTVGVDGRLDPVRPVVGERVLSSETAATVRDVLASVVQGDRGTGANARVDGHLVGGKTGTARRPSAQGGYDDAHVATFVGMAPIDAPRVVVGVMVDDPYPIWGGVVAAPVFSDVTAEALRRLQVAPGLDGPGWSTVLTDAQRAARTAVVDGAGPGAGDAAAAGTPGSQG